MGYEDATFRSGNFDYALDTADSMADSESDLETDRLELALDTLCDRHCSNESSLKSKGYCSEFCEVRSSPFSKMISKISVCLPLKLIALLANVALCLSSLCSQGCVQPVIFKGCNVNDMKRDTNCYVWRGYLLW